MMEMKNVRCAFEIFEGKVEYLVGYQKVKYHIIWDIKLGENFCRKVRLVAGGHTTDTPSSLTYSSVVSRDSVRIALTIAAMNNRHQKCIYLSTLPGKDLYNRWKRVWI